MLLLKKFDCLTLLFIPSSHHQLFVFTCNYSVGSVGNPHIYPWPGAARALPSRAPLRSHQEETVAELRGAEQDAAAAGSPPPAVSRRAIASISGKINTAGDLRLLYERLFTPGGL